MTLLNAKSVLQVSDLHFSYPDRELFTDFSANFPPGITLICGGDGCGKSTLLKLLAGVLPAQSGRLHIHGVDLQTQPAKYMARIFWNEPRSDAFDQLTLPDYFKLQRTRYPDFDDEVLTNMTEGLGLQEHLHKRLFMLSTGSKRKVFLAAAFASGAALLLFDEPFAALDAISIGFVLSCLKAATSDTHKACVVADYAAPMGLLLAQKIDLGN